jgi:hypothetical protein
MVKYRVFDTEQEAIDAEAIVAADMGLPKVGVNAKTHKSAPSKQMTTHWANIQQIQDGRWVFISPDDVGVEKEDNWFPDSEQI